MQNKISIFILLLILGCTSSEKPITIEETPSVLSSELPVGFHDFYDSFHSDSLFQLSHIVFPLQGQMTRRDSMETISIDKEYLEESWKLHKPFNSDAGYNRNFTVMGDLVIERMVDNMGLYTVERRWGKVDSTWSLIYYGTDEKSW